MRGGIPVPMIWDAKGDPKLRMRIIVAGIVLEVSMFLTLSQKLPRRLFAIIVRMNDLKLREVVQISIFQETALHMCKSFKQNSAFSSGVSLPPANSSLLRSGVLLGNSLYGSGNLAPTFDFHDSG